MPTDGRGPVESDDPGVLEALVVHAEDVVTAYEARTRSGERAVLRVTPPFSARMRARIHVAKPGEYADQGGPDQIHVDPGRLLAGSAPDYPEPDETAVEVPGDPPDPETHHDHHCRAVAEWRERAAEHVRDHVTVETGGRSLAVDVAVLG